MVGYVIIILASLNGIFKRRFSVRVFFGDLFISLGLLISAIFVSFFGHDRSFMSMCILTPAVLIWASIHFFEMLKNNNANNKKI